MKKVPELRFKEFTDEWEEKKLGEIVENISSGKTIIKSEIGKYKVYGSMGQIGWSNCYNYSGENILIARVGANAGNLNYVYGNYGVSDNTLIACTNKGYINKFLYYSLKNYNLNRLIFGSGQPLITASQLKKIQFYFPKETEQQKIADFLSAVDEKIEKSEKKVELLKDYKKGMMQKIFAQEIRFKDENGNDYPAWEEKKLGEIIIKNKEKNSSGIYKKVQSISNKYGFIDQQEYFEDRKIASDNLTNYYIVKEKAFAYNPSRIETGSLGYKIEKEIGVISPLYISFYSKENYINDKFLLNWFYSNEFIRQMHSSFEGSVRNNLSYDNFSKFIIFIPKIKEQQKIADFLSVVDEKIEKEEKKVEELKEFKKGLLQKMFV